MDSNEKIILLACLFRAIGKFEQYCIPDNSDKNSGFCSGFIDSKRDILLGMIGSVEADGNGSAESEYVNRLKRLVTDPIEDMKSTDSLHEAIRLAHRLSCGNGPLLASEATNTSHPNEPSLGSPPCLPSIFHTVSLASKTLPPVKYFNQEVLSDSSLRLSDESGNSSKQCKRFNAEDFSSFVNHMNTIIDSYDSIGDFLSIYTLLLNLCENYFWCLPVDEKQSHTGISLFNYSRDLAGLAHAIYKSPDSANLSLINVELVGKVNYMSNIVYAKPAKILRGRSIFVQVVTRIVVSIILKDLGLSDASIIMNAAGKILIVAPGNLVNSTRIAELTSKIESTLKINFQYELSFGIGVTEFPKEPDDNWSFGDVVEASNIQQQRSWQKLYFNDLFDPVADINFILPGEYFRPRGEFESDRMKCKVTDKPIIKGREDKIKQRYLEDGVWKETELVVDLQVANEFRIGDIVPKDTIVIAVDENEEGCFVVQEPKRLSKFSSPSESKLIINQKLREIIKALEEKPGLFKDAAFIDVANYATMLEPFEENLIVMDFETMTKKNIGAEFLTMIKGDIDNFGIILSCGLKNHSISSHSTLSSQLKYFFSFGLNNILAKWCDDQKTDRVVYCVYSGGDDIFFVTPQSSAIELINDLNQRFTEFTCSNPEVHISYSFTNFKHHTPIRIVSDFADRNQSEIKKKYKNKQEIKDDEPIPEDYFFSANDKAGSMIFETPVKNNRLDDIIKWTDLLSRWVSIKENPPITKGALRYIFDLSKMINKYHDGDQTSLFWHPKLTYFVKRNIDLESDSLNDEDKKEFNKFIEEMLALEFKAGSDIKEILTTVTSAVILITRE